MHVMHIVSLIVEVVLAGYIVVEVVRFVPQYRRLKEAIAAGDPRARTRVYEKALAFEWISALLALVALGFDWSKLNPQFLDLSASIPAIAHGSDFARGGSVGVLIGVAAGTAAIIVGRIRANRRGAARTPHAPGAADATKPWWRKLLPDFSALLPVTTRERLIWAAVAVSAGICEEIVFRGWLLAALHGQLRLSGVALICVAAAIFGLAHVYQRATGVILTALAGAFFCFLYVVTGSLLVPIVLHVLIDARFALLPAPRIPKPQASASFA